MSSRDPKANVLVPLFAKPLTAKQAEDMASLLKVLVDPTRLRIISIIAAEFNGPGDGWLPFSVLKWRVPLASPEISHHVRILVMSGMVERDKHGVWVSLRLVPKAFEQLVAELTPKEQRVKRRRSTAKA